MEEDFEDAFVELALTPPILKKIDNFTYTSNYENTDIKITLWSLGVDNKYSIDTILVKGLPVSSFKEMIEACLFHSLIPKTDFVSSSDDNFESDDKSWEPDDEDASWEYNLNDSQFNDLKESLIKSTAQAFHSGIDVVISSECKGFEFTVEYKDTNSLLFKSKDGTFVNDFMIEDQDMEGFITGNVFGDGTWIPMYEAYADFLGQKEKTYG